ncbi:anhydro-N-acetylmuramic acid kinase [Mucilaginibacter sp. HMF5004]|uniref:anhydro-N-acetylmuramic acid kinase n=1 Tax=Mucilaginibacter rivuli TaxID=2857527 RepID=UPI001C5D60C3|nr:anhydro-N-acetylmuramic acid kinase [Mucilaginibacter rivuli]MBW4891748.1 anhydro-N-acetylmuramic acid kinase [Mucilaginibacter rivuli]
MNVNLETLFKTAQKQKRIGVGLMSGTSLDGLDIALCKFSGNGLKTTFELLEFKTVDYNNDFKYEVRQVFARKTVDLEKLCMLNEYIGDYHGRLVNEALKSWAVGKDEVDYIASHGQTIYHAPQRLHGQDKYPNSTLQIGDGDHIAVKTGILTISDFRQKHLAAGGEGAPLALYGDYILGSKRGEDRVLMNIGGISNFTYLPADGDGRRVMCSDIGPGNTLIDAACKKYFDRDYDKNSEIAFSGQVNHPLLNALLAHPFFKEELPKTTGPELFNLEYLGKARQQSDTAHIEAKNIIATLSAFTAHVIAKAVLSYGAGVQLFISGGGGRNPFVIQQLEKLLPGISINKTDKLGIPPDAKEAILFALLGNEALCGNPLTIGKNPAVLMGKFSFPT